MVSSFFTTYGGHLRLSDFYRSDFDRLFIGHSLYPVGQNTVEKHFVRMFLGSGGISTHLSLPLGNYCINKTVAIKYSNFHLVRLFK